LKAEAVTPAAAASSEEEEIAGGLEEAKEEEEIAVTPMFLMFLGLMNGFCFSQQGKGRCVRCGRDWRTRDLGRGEQMSLNRVMHVDRRFRFNFPAVLRAFISIVE
jgi:hypothetical protein